MAEIINGKAVAGKIRERIKTETEKLGKMGQRPKIAVIVVGNDPASLIYARSKEKACGEVGISSCTYRLSYSAKQSEVIELIEELNDDGSVNGILLELPLPEHINSKEVIERISPLKDVDSLHPTNIGKILTGDYIYLPCTPAGIMELLEDTGIETSGKNCVIIGRSSIVGKPIALLMIQKDTTVTICHSKTENLKEICLNADIIITSVGREKFLTADMVSEKAIVIDVGINRDSEGRLCGDADFENVAQKVRYITPVPGGVGPMTITMLLSNTLKAFNEQNRIKEQKTKSAEKLNLSE